MSGLLQYYFFFQNFIMRFSYFYTDEDYEKVFERFVPSIVYN